MSRENASANPSNFSNSFLGYDDPGLGIHLTYPAEWQVVEFPPGGAGFGAFLEGTGDRFVVQVGILANDELPASGESTEQYFQRQVNNTLADYPGFALESQSMPTVIDGNPAFKADFIDSIETPNASFTTEIWTIENNKAYQIETSIDSRYYQDYLLIVQKMIDSLGIEDMQQEK